MKNLNALVNDRSKKIFKLIIAIVVICSVALNVIVLKEKTGFDAEFLSEFEASKYGDPIMLVYNENEYALMNLSTPYCFRTFDPEIELTYLYRGSYLESILSHKYMVYGSKIDPNRMFLWCGYKHVLDPYDKYRGGCYYRTDFEFPDMISDNIEEINIYQLSNVICSITDKEMIKWFLGEHTEIAKKDIMEYLRDEVEAIDIDASEMVAYAKFMSLPLEYDLGYLDCIEENQPFESYGEKGIDDGSSSWWDYYLESDEE